MDLDEIKLVKADVDNWIKSVDQKISIILAFEAAVIALAAKPVFIFLAELYPIANNVHLCIIVLISVLFLTVGTLKALHALIPKLKMPKQAKSLIYFGSIAEMDSETFIKSAKKVQEPAYRQDLLEQIHINSKICTKKHQQLTSAIYLLIVAGLGIILSLILAWLER